MNAVSDIIIKYAKLISELPFSAGDAPRIIFRHDGRCYMTARGADFTDVKPEDIQDITDHDQAQLPAAAALMRSKSLTAMILCDEKQIEKALLRSTSVMVENSCLIAGGRNLYEAYVALQIIEKSAETVLKAQVIGGVRRIDPRISRFMHYRYQHSYSKAEKELQDAEENAQTADQELQEEQITGDAAEVGSSAEHAGEWSEHERELREQLVRYGNMLVSTGLVQGTWGNLSVMLDRENMLCTPSGLDYSRLRPEDMVRVNIRTLKAEGLHKPTSEKGMHAGIYRKYPEANAVIHTHSKYCSIFAAGEMPLQVESKEKIEQIGEIISVSRYALAGTGGITRSAVKAIGGNPGCILAHHGMIAKGSDLEEAFRNVCLIEEAAEEYINKRLEK